MANVLGELFGEIATAIREKTGETDTMKPAQFPEKILAIEGGSSADVRYVTFMSHDGTVEYGKKAVAVGDDCADPIARGVFSTPTRESDAQYNYTFYGWATEVNGAANSNALKAVTEDRTVYVNYASTVRYYTITYYDSDGTTVLKTESLAYGSTPKYEPEKEGCVFDTWSPTIDTVSGNAEYVAQFREKMTLDDFTWEELDAMSVDEIRAKFMIGDMKYVHPTAQLWPFILVGIEHDDLADGSGKAKMTFIRPAIAVGSSESYGTGMMWPDSKHQISLNSVVADNTLFSSTTAYDDDTRLTLTGLMKMVNKEYVSVVTDDGYETDVYAAKAWMPSAYELGYVASSIPVEGSTYEYFSEKTSFNTALEGSESSNTLAIRTTSNTGGTYLIKNRALQSVQKNYLSSAGKMLGFCI